MREKAAVEEVMKTFANWNADENRIKHFTRRLKTHLPMDTAQRVAR